MHVKDSDYGDYGTQQSRTPPIILFAWGQRQIQSLKRRVLKIRTMDNVQNINIYMMKIQHRIIYKNL
jgi:hypothetical protein